MARKPPAQDPAPRQVAFSASGRTRIQVAFDEPELSSDGVALLLREAARIHGLMVALTAAGRATWTVGGLPRRLSPTGVRGSLPDPAIASRKGNPSGRTVRQEAS
jgi:hypothetical protein